MDWIRELLTGMCLFGAAASFALYLGLRHARRLPADGGACGCGAGPGGSHSDGGDEEQPSVSVSFSESALLYEDAYTNEPGVVVERRVSTNVTLTCIVNGGQHGGLFCLSRSGFDRLLLVDGDVPPSAAVEIAAGETRTWSAVYAPLTHSSSANDISAEATFDEYLSGDSLSDEAFLTVVKLLLEPQTTKAGCENRHLVGIRETINCYAEPDVGQWGETGGGEYYGTTGYTGYYKCPLTADGSVLYYSVGGSRYDCALVVVEPTAMIALSPVAMDFGVATNHAGGAGMDLDVYVLPETVSFSGVAMEEIPSETGVHQGYFSNMYFTNVWYHTTAMSAGNWQNVKDDNLWETDCARMGDELPRELPDGEMTLDLSQGTWSDGTLVWDITWGWAERNRSTGDQPVKSISTAYNQTFTFTEDGTLTVLKFQHSVSRGTNNVIRLNGNVVQGIPVN